MAIFYGADVSTYQGNIDWQAFNPGAAFVFIKAGGGDDGNYVDDKLAANKAGARSLGNAMPRGFYWFGGNGSATDEADYFVTECVPDLQVGEILVLDSEFGKSLDPAWCLEWLQRVEARTGVKPLIYMSASRVTEKDWSAVAANGNGLWVADYAVAPADNVPIKYWAFYAFQQYSDSGTFPGIAGKVDTNAFFAKALNDFFRYGKQPETVVAPVLPPPAPTTPPSAPPAPVVPSLSPGQGSGENPDGSVNVPVTVKKPLPPPAPVDQPGEVVSPSIPKNEEQVIEEDVKSIMISKYNKFLVAIAGAIVTFLLQHYGSSPVVKDVVLALTALGVWQFPNVEP